MKHLVQNKDRGGWTPSYKYKFEFYDFEKSRRTYIDGGGNIQLDRATFNLKDSYNKIRILW